MISVKMSRI